MCEHVRLTARSGERASYGLMDCTKLEDGELACKLTDKSLAHLMASGQFKEITVEDVEDEVKGVKVTSSEELRSKIRTYKEADFPAFISQHLGVDSLDPRHHAPSKVGMVTR